MKKELTLKEFKERKIVLENQVAQLIHEFEQKTGITIEGFQQYTIPVKDLSEIHKYVLFNIYFPHDL